MRLRKAGRRVGCAVVLAVTCAIAGAADLVLVEKGVSRAPIVVASNAPAETLAAAKDLASYLRKIGGASPDLIVGDADPTPASAIWVGPHPKVAGLFPKVNLDFQYPEEILSACNGQHVLIAGRDRIVGGKQTEYGTVNAVYTFLEKRLGVRWLWPGPLGEDVLQRETIALPAFEDRFHPVFLQRHFWPRQPREWHRAQRLLHYSRVCSWGHGFTDWWDKYHETHPEYFALQPNGTRAAPREGSTVKLCLSNPGVWTQWLDNAEAKLRADPSLTMVSASPNDGPWHCTCTNCRAWDHPDAAPGVLTERHVKFWNILARGLRERFPDREVYVGVMAYAAYLTPPIAEKLEKNIAVAQVGHFPLTDEANREQAKKEWRQWADMATLMFYRPNLWYWAGGVWSLPEVAMRKTIEDWRFLADNKCAGITVDSVRMHWATQGPQYYLMAQLTYDPRQDGAAVMKDYYRRGFGPAAAEIEAYWTLMEDARDALVGAPDFKRGSANRFKLPPIIARTYSEDFMARADRVLQDAESRVTDGPDVYRRRVAFVRSGFDFTRQLVRGIPIMTRVRDSGGADKAAVDEAIRNWGTLEQIVSKAEPRAISFKALMSTIQGNAYMGGMQDYFGPPSEEFRNAVKVEPVRFRPAQWTLAFSDDFQRAELGADWTIARGAWSIADGRLVGSEGVLLCDRTFPGFHKFAFDVEVTPNPGISDVSPMLHAAAPKLNSGYLLQFGGRNNTASVIQRLGKSVRENERVVIQAGKVHAVTAEYDGKQVRLTVDGTVVLEYPESQPLLGPGHDRIGLYIHEGVARIDNVRVYTSPAIPQSESAMEGVGFE